MVSSIFKKDYKEISSEELHGLAEGLCERLHLFNYEYPEELGDLMHGVWGHPHLLEEDRDLLSVYCDYYEYEWKENEGQLLCVSPVFLEGTHCTTVEDVGKTRARLQRAGVDFVERLKEQMTSI